MFTPAELYHLLDVGAGLAAIETVKLGTKAAFDALKQSIVERFGPKAETALVAIEAGKDPEAARTALSAAVPTVAAEDVEAIGPALRAFVHAIRSDPVAQARAKLDIDVDGNIVIGTIENVRDLDLKARAGQDFTLDRLSFLTGDDRGN